MKDDRMEHDLLAVASRLFDNHVPLGGYAKAVGGFLPVGVLMMSPDEMAWNGCAE
jgi:hypothetical protein